MRPGITVFCRFDNRGTYASIELGLGDYVGKIYMLMKSAHPKLDFTGVTLKATECQSALMGDETVSDALRCGQLVDRAHIEIPTCACAG